MNLTRAEVLYLRSFGQKKVRQTEKKFLLEGWRALHEAAAARAPVEFVAIDPAHEPADLPFLQRTGWPIRHIRGQDLEKIADTVHSQGVVALVRQKTASLASLLRSNPSLLVAVDSLADPGNLGTILRTCEWFGVDGLLLGQGSAELHNPKVVRSSAGAIFHLGVAEQIDLEGAIRECRSAGFRTMVAAGDTTTDVMHTEFATKTLLVLGNEGHGVSDAVRSAADSVVCIPRFGRVESLNVGVAAGIFLAAIRGRKSSKK